MRRASPRPWCATAWWPRPGRRGVPFQYEVLPYGGTDAGAIMSARGGVPSGTLSIPCRYVHSPVETVSLTDMENAVKLLKAYVEKIVR